MTRTQLTLIACLAVAGLLWWTHDDGVHADRERAREAFLPALAEEVNDAAEITVTGPNDAVELQRVDGVWRVASKSGYPARFEPVRDLLIDLARLSDAEPRTARPDRHGDLQVAAEGEGTGTRVEVRSDGGDVLADVWVGKSQWSPSEAVYLRREGEDQVWLCGGSLRPQAGARTWLDMQLVALPAAKVQRVVISGDLELVLERDADGDPRPVGGVPEGRELEPADPFTPLFGQAARINFDDVTRADGEHTVGEPLRRVRFEAGDGGAVVLELWRGGDGGGPWARLHAEASEAPPAPVGPQPESDGGAATTELVVTAAQAESWNEAWEPWAFQLPAWKAEALLATWEDWLAEPAAADEVESDGATDNS
ncbi:DUF4340 domain-containing protein [Engelhardtia mirabilis]|uniref:DUF4340 domain-containing protein n=1 Tax=Engelhardtia mirabilis TaxID=2528011 RepID=A0A518BMD5_9BACT|nr:hypothetical protein Pla133_32010 [Planctomycetes bacterium Pla133]QDV02433.1 hypothetical protein Pla86_32000 [Planctomycetes bacterium Pla86]